MKDTHDDISPFVPTIAKETYPDVVYLTRDTVGGDLSNQIEVWVTKPERVQYEDLDVCWFADALVVDSQPTNIDTISVDKARLRFGPGIPESDRELTVVGVPGYEDTRTRASVAAGTKKVLA